MAVTGGHPASLVNADEARPGTRHEPGAGAGTPADRAVPLPGDAPGGADGDGRPVMVVLRGLGLGDLLTAVPALRALRRAFPAHRITLAAPAPLAGLLPLIGACDDLLDVTGPGPVPLHRPDLAVNLHGSGPRSTVALLATHPGRLISHAHPGLPLLPGPPWPARTHERVRWCDLLTWHGIPADPTDLALRPPATAGHTAARHAAGGPAPAERPAPSGQAPSGPCLSGPGPVIVHPGAAHPARRWPPDRFAAVAAALHHAGHDVLVTGTAAERGLARRVAAAAGLPEEAVTAGRTDVTGLAALVASARLVVCGDTGVAHLAGAFGTPSVVLFGPTPPALWGPPEGPHTVLWHGDPGRPPGDPHAGRPDPALLTIGVEEVLDAATDLLEVTVR
ncbi:glycosyltransferase family 9 protein [Streptosporangium sandarakinum]|uniref:glycosyltransferase family 9 protein n=1 Tax=Streptosporangium sandarakinum TaxID=1260955 RepID=UPI0033AB2634